MPYIKKQRSAIRSLLQSYDITDGAHLGRILNKPPKTGRRRMDDPDTLTVGEIRRLSTHGHIPIEELRAAIK